jgi:hypothetical protein
VEGKLNLNGNTSFAGVGLTWREYLLPKFFTDYSFGVNIHDGTLEVPSPNFATDPIEFASLSERKANEIEFGSRVLFRNAFSFGYDLSDDTTIELVWEHMSHAKVFDEVNEGINNVGVRIGRKF